MIYFQLIVFIFTCCIFIILFKNSMYPITSALRLAILVSLFLFSFTGHAQKFSAKNSEKIAKEYFRVEEYAQALPLYLKLDSVKPNNPHIMGRVGICYLHTEF